MQRNHLDADTEVLPAAAAGQRVLVLAHPTLTRRRLLATWASFMERRP